MLVRQLKTKWDNVVTEASQVIELTAENQTRVEIKAMGLATLRLSTMERTGPIRLNIEPLSKGNYDLTCVIDWESNVSIDNFIWCFKNKQSMVLKPKKAYDHF